MKDSGWKTRKPRCGMLFIECNWFKSVGMGKEAPGGSLSQRVSERTEKVRDSLSTDLEVIYAGLVSDVDGLRAAMMEFTAREVDFVLASFTTWAEDFAWVRFLRDFPARVPVLFWCQQPDRIEFADNDSPDDFVSFLSATGLVGALEGSGSVRLTAGNERAVRSICGSLAARREEIVRFGKAAKARSVLGDSRIGLFQSFNEAMWSTYVDPFRFFVEVGPEVTVVPFEALRKATESVSDGEADEYVEALRGRYRVADGVKPDLLRESARASIGLLKVAAERGFDAVAFNDVDDHLHEVLGLRPGFCHPRFDETGSVLVPEGDVGMAALALALRVMTGKPGVFVEPLFLNEEKNTFAAGHAGPNSHAAARPEDVTIMPDAEYENSEFRYAGAPFAWFTVPEGPMTMVHFGQGEWSYRVVCSLVESVPVVRRLKGYAGGNFRPPGDVNAFFRHLMEAGVTQHYLLIEGDHREAVREYAAVSGFGIVEVGV